MRGVPIYEDERHDMATEALMRAVLALFEKVVALNPNLPDDSFVAAMNEKDPGSLADLLAHVLDLEPAQRQELLETLDPHLRLQRLSIILGQELDVLELEDRIQNQVQQEVDKSQREYYLREQMRAIQTELGEVDEEQRELIELREKIAAARLPEPVRVEGREGTGQARPRCRPPRPRRPSSATTWTGCSTCPGTTATEDNLDVKAAAQVLEHNHYGLPQVKERILEHIAVRKLAQDKMKSPILCFVGPPGTGKTSLGKSIAEALGRKFVRLSLGGVRDEAEIRGHRRTYIGSLPGRIIQTMHSAGAVNPLFMLDEIDKLGIDFRGDPVVGAARSARPGAEPRLQRSLPRSAVRPEPGDVHHHRQHARSDPAGPARPAGGHRVPRLHRGREAGHRPPVPDPAAARGARPDQPSRSSSASARCGR